MTFPPARYHGQTGELTATLRRGDDKPDLAYPSGNAVSFLATGAATGGEFGLYRYDFGTQVTGADAHFHRTYTESFYILAGTVRVYDGSDWVDANQGDYLLVPQGGIHGFKNESGEPASMLLLFTPGAPREEYFETLAEIAAGKTLSDQERTELFLKHDNHWL